MTLKPELSFAAGARKIILTGIFAFAATFAVAQDDSAGAESTPGADVARPSTAEIMENPILRNALSRSSEGLVTRRAPDGTVSIDLQGRFQNVSMVRIDASGEFRFGCASSHASLAEFLAAHPDASEDDYVSVAKGDRDEE